MQCSAARPDLVGQRGGAAVVEQHQVELLRPVAGRDPGPQSRCTGSSARRWTSGAAAAGTPRGRASVGTSFSMPITVISVSRQGQAHPAVALGLDHAAGCRSRRRRSWRRRSRPWPRRNLRRRCARAAIGQPARLVGRAPGRRRASRAGRSPGSRRGCGGSPAPGCATACRAPSWTISSARSVSHAAMPAASSASLSPISWVAIDLTLTTSSAPVARTRSVTIAVGLVGVARPSARRRRGR